MATRASQLEGESTESSTAAPDAAFGGNAEENYCSDSTAAPDAVPVRKAEEDEHAKLAVKDVYALACAVCRGEKFVLCLAEDLLEDDVNKNPGDEILLCENGVLHGHGSEVDGRVGLA